MPDADRPDELEDIDLDDDELDDDGVASRGRGSRTPRPPGPLDERIAAVAREICRQRNWSYQDLADRIVPAHHGEAWDKSRAVRFLTAKKRITVTELADICRALEVTPEWFYQQAGIVRLPDSTKGWIEADAHLDPEDRRALARQYQLARAARGDINGS